MSDLKKLPKFVEGKHMVFTSFHTEKVSGELVTPDWEPKYMEYLVAQVEICPTTKKKHWQGFVTFKDRKKYKPACEHLGLPSTTHAEKLMGTPLQASEYCKKLETRAPDGAMIEEGKLPDEKSGSGRRTDLESAAADLKAGMSMREMAEYHTAVMIKYYKGMEHVARLLAPLVEMPMPDTEEWEEWQSVVMETIEKGFKKRQILWVWSEESKRGKSTMQDIIQATYQEECMEGVWTKSDMLYQYDKHKVIVFNLPRQQGLHAGHLAVLEAMSDGGMKLSTKYEPKQKLINSVIIVFANIPPPHDLMPERCVEFWIDSEEYKRNHAKPDAPELAPIICAATRARLDEINEQLDAYEL